MDTGFAVLIGIIVGSGLTYFIMWNLDRKISDLVPGGLRAWDKYDKDNNTWNQQQAPSPTARTVTE